MNQIDIFQNHFKAFFPEIFFVVAIMCILLYAVIYNPSARHRYPILINLTGWLGIQTLFIVILLLVNWNICQPHATVVAFHNVLITDDFSFVVKTIVALSALASVLISLDNLRNQKMYSYEYTILILFSTLSMLLITSSYDLISMYLAIELQSLSFYVLAAFRRDNEFSTEAGLKYFILGALSSGLLLFGESIIYGLTGITNFEELTKLFSCATSQNACSYTPVTSADGSALPWDSVSLFQQSHDSTLIVQVGLIFLLVAFLFKISAVPFHMWAPDVYEGAPTSVTAFFAITPKIAILALLLRLCLYTFYDFIELWQQPIAICSILSMFIGTFGAINQTKIKRLFAYSSIAHIGYMLLGLATGTIEAVESLLIYIIVYIFMIINVFAVILATPRHEVHPHFASAAQTPSLAREQVAANSSFRSSIAPWGSIYKMAPNAGFAEAGHRHLKASYPLWNPLSDSAFSDLPSLKPLPKEGGARIVTPTMAPAFGGTRVSGSNMNDGHKMKLPGTKRDTSLKYISDLRFLAEANPILAATLVAIFFSNAGIPPLAGFYGKLNVFLAAVEESMYFLALMGILCSVIGAFYSIRLVKIIYFHSSRGQDEWTQHEQISKQNAIVLGFTFFFTLFFFFFADPAFIFTLTHSAALSLCL
uniref:NADH dehydrogenase subunit 2 n=1 Tax=Marophrys sp. SRT127 TaxID=2488311 RepID=A0A455RFQ3_9EUKA|nr:NADH dehydrogenase subunit 2 [Marophrys sp. SRT127]